MLLAGCGSSIPAIKPFKMDIQQGNVVTSKMLLQLKPGMTKSQVRFIMGTPLIVDSFHKDRWDYFFQMRQAGKIIEQRRVILDFEKELLTKVRGDVVPQGAAGAAVDEAPAANTPIIVEPKPKETSMLDKLKFWKKDEKVIAKPEVKPELMKPAVPVQAAVAPIESAATLPEVPAAETPSVLAVPIELPNTDAPPAAETAKEEPAVIAPLKTQPLKTEPVATKPPAAPSVSSNMLPIKKPSVAESKPMPSSAKKGEQQIFRMDKTLDLERGLAVKPEKMPVPAAPASVPSTEAMPKPIKAEAEPLPVETEPSFFDKMLEKIGF